MRKTKTLLAASLLLMVSAVAAGDSDSAARSETNFASLPTVALEDLLEAVGRKSGQDFLIDSATFPSVVIGQVRMKDIDYPMLLTILRNNELAAVRDGRVVSIIPAARIRQYAIPIVNEDDDALAGDEWVSRIIEVRNLEAPPLVPILRPLLPRHGHLAAHPGANSIIIVDRYANVERVAALIAGLDAAAQP